MTARLSLISPTHHTLISAWLLRGLLALLLFFGAEVLLWIDPPGRTLPEWVLLAVGYMALSTLVLDLAARFRIRTIYETMMIFGIYGLLVGLLLNPETTHVDFPRTLATRAIGAHALLGLEMFGFFLVLTGGHQRRHRRNLIAASIWLGFYWGVWVRWSPSLIGWAPQGVSLNTMFTVATAVMIPIVLVFLVATRRNDALTLLDFRLPPAALGVLIMVLIGLFLLQVIQENVEAGVVVATVALIGICWVVLWYQRSDKGRTVLDEHIPTTALSPVWLLLAIGIFSGMTVLAYNLALLDIVGFNQFLLMEFGFALVGFGWFPLVVGFIGARAYERQSRTQPL